MASDTDMNEIELFDYAYESEGEQVASGDEVAANPPAAAEDAPQAEQPEHEAPEPEATEPGPSAGVTRTGKGIRKNKQGKGKACTRTRLLAKARQRLVARRAAVADVDEQVANLPRSEDLGQNEQVAPDPVVFSDDERLEFDELPPFVPALHARGRTVPDVTRVAAASLGTRSTPLSGTGATEVVDREAQLARMEASLKEASDELNHLRQTCDNQMGFIHSLLDMVHPSTIASGSVAVRAPAPAPAPPVAPAFTPVLKPLEPRKPKPFSGEGDAAQHGHVRRFLRVLTQFFELSKLPPELWAPHARMYLEDSAAEHMDTAIQMLPAAERDDWAKFCEILTSGFGTLDLDAEAWAKLRVLKHRNLTASEYVHQMRACFNGIFVLLLSAGEKIERFLEWHHCVALVSW